MSCLLQMMTFSGHIHYITGSVLCYPTNSRSLSRMLHSLAAVQLDYQMLYPYPGPRHELADVFLEIWHTLGKFVNKRQKIRCCEFYYCGILHVFLLVW